MVWEHITNFFTQNAPSDDITRRKQTKPVYRNIDGARLDRLTSSWTTMSITPDEQIRSHWRALVARSRDLAINDPYMARYVRSCRANIVGHGPKLRCYIKQKDGKEDFLTNEAVRQSWAEWCDDGNICDVTGQQTFLSLSLSVVHSMAVDGEAFVKLVDDGPFGTQLQLLDAVRCPSDYNVDSTSLGTFIRNGIEYNRNGRPIAYHFTTDDTQGSYYGFNGYSYIRIPADQICHVYRKNTADQRRGFPWATSSLYRLKHLKEFEDNAAVNARLSASKMGFISYPEGGGPDNDDDKGTAPITAEPGSIIELSDGASFQAFNPSFPDDAYGAFVKSGLRAVSSGLGVNYTTLGNDLEGVNFSSIRAGMLDERELFKEDQRLFIERFVKPVFKRWLAEALLHKKVVWNDSIVSSTKRKIIEQSTTFVPRRWDWVDPKSEAIANQKSMESGIKSPQEIIRERGRDPEEVIDEIASWWKLCAEKGVPREALQTSWGEQVKTTINDEDNLNDNN